MRCNFHVSKERLRQHANAGPRRAGSEAVEIAPHMLHAVKEATTALEAQGFETVAKRHMNRRWKVTKVSAACG